MITLKKITLCILILSSTSVIAEFKCSDRSYTLTLSESRPGIPPEIKVSPSLVHGGGTTVGTYRFKRTYPLWSDRSKDKSDYQQPGAFTGFVSIEGWGPQRIELLCTDAGGKNPDISTYSSISNTVSWESKKGDFQGSLKEGDIVRVYPATYRQFYRYSNGKLVPFSVSQNTTIQANLNNAIRAPIQVITPIAVAAKPSAPTTKDREPTSTSTQETQTKTQPTLSCSEKKKAEIKLRYQETANVLDLLYKQKKSDLGCD